MRTAPATRPDDLVELDVSPWVVFVCALALGLAAGLMLCAAP